MWLQIGILALLVVLLLVIARLLISSPEYMVRLVSLMVPASTYPTHSDAYQMAKLMQEDPKEWLNRNPRSAQLYRRMGYMCYAIAGGGILIGVLQFIDAVTRFLIYRSL